MNLIRKQKEMWDPFDVFADLQTDLNRTFTRSLLKKDGWGSAFEPDIEVEEGKEHLTLKADLPGFQKPDIKLSVEGDILTLKGERKQERKSEEKGVTYSERFYGSFVRRIQLPAEVDTAKVKAAYKDGVLEVTLPKSERAKPKEIDVDVN